MMKMLGLVILVTVPFVLAQDIGDPCVRDADCGSLTCILMLKPNSETLEPEGKCMPKLQEYHPCMMDSNCENGLQCTKHPLMNTPAPIMGMCTQCTSDLDCQGSEYCDHPVMNLGCVETLGYFGAIEKKKKKAEYMQKMMMRKMMGSDMGSDMGGDMEDEEEMKRKKRGIGHWALNYPTLRCTDRKQRNMPCARSPECQGGTCSVEGICK